MMTMNRNDMIRALTTFGFSAFKACEVAIDAERGDRYALQWVLMAVEQNKAKTAT